MYRRTKLICNLLINYLLAEIHFSEYALSGPILEFQGRVGHFQKGHSTFVTQVDLILQN